MDTSPDSDVHIITSSLLNPKEQVLNYLHEAYGHAVLYDRKQHGQNVNPNHIYVVKVIGEEFVEELGTYIQVTGRIDTNQKLQDRIQTAQKEFLTYWEDE